MSFKDSELHDGHDDKMNHHYQNLLKDQLIAMDNDGKDVQNHPHQNPNVNPTGKASMMDFTAMLEAMDDILSLSNQDTSDSTSIANQNMEEESPMDNSDLLNKLNQIFTPVLVSQKIEQQVSDQANAALSEASVLNEKTMISFDDKDRMAQLLAVCSLLIAQKKNTEQWQMYQKAAAIKTNMKLAIQKSEHEAAKILAQQFLVKVSTTNNSSVARQAAKDLLPQTQY